MHRRPLSPLLLSQFSNLPKSRPRRRSPSSPRPFFLSKRCPSRLLANVQFSARLTFRRGSPRRRRLRRRRPSRGHEDISAVLPRTSRRLCRLPTRQCVSSLLLVLMCCPAADRKDNNDARSLRRLPLREGKNTFDETKTREAVVVSRAPRCCW